jgi:hypothetical protein
MYVVPREIRGCWHGLPAKGGCDMGAIRKRGRNYIITYYEGSGRRRWETVGPNLHEARQVLADRMSERRTGKSRVPRDKMTVAELVKKWKENYLTVQQQLGRLKPSTLRSYQCNLDGHIAPFFGAMLLAEVRLASVEEFIKTLLGKGLSPTCSPRSGPNGMSESARLPAGRTPPCGAGDSRRSRSSGS